MKRMRKEKDPLGWVEIPSDAPYGPQTARAVSNFPISGRTADPALIRAYLKIKKAAALANRRCGVLDARRAGAIVGAVEHILKLPLSQWRDIFPVDIYQAGAGTSQNMNINEVVAHFASRRAKVPVHPNDHVNRSQSTNDTFPTAMRLALLEASQPLVAAVEELARSFEKHSKKWNHTPKAARTHLQDAVPMRLGQEFSGYAAALRHCATWVQQGRRELLALGISGSAAGTGVTVPPGFGREIVRILKELTGEPLILYPNLFEAMQSQAPVLHYSSMLRLTGVELTRICNDLRLLASGPMTGLGELELPKVQPGSSIMPGKVNPSILEMANQTWFAVLGYDTTALLACQAGQLELNVMMPVMAHSLIEATRIATNSLQVLKARCVDGLHPNPLRMKRYFESTPQIATALSPRLGYERTAQLVQDALRENISVLEMVRREKLIPESELEALLNLRALTGPGV